MPLTMPEPRYFSIPSRVLGGTTRSAWVLNCRPCVRSVTHPPCPSIYSPGVMVAAVPTTVTRSRCPRTLTRRTQKPVSSLWKVTRSTAPVSCSVGWVLGDGGAKVFIDCSRAYREGISRSHCGRDTQRSHMLCIPGRTCTRRAYYTPEQYTRALTIRVVERPPTGPDG